MRQTTRGGRIRLRRERSGSDTLSCHPAILYILSKAKKDRDMDVQVSRDPILFSDPFLWSLTLPVLMQFCSSAVLCLYSCNTLFLFPSLPASHRCGCDLPRGSLQTTSGSKQRNVASGRNTGYALTCSRRSRDWSEPCQRVFDTLSTRGMRCSASVWSAATIGACGRNTRVTTMHSNCNVVRRRGRLGRHKEGSVDGTNSESGDSLRRRTRQGLSSRRSFATTLDGSSCKLR